MSPLSACFRLSSPVVGGFLLEKKVGILNLMLQLESVYSIIYHNFHCINHKCVYCIDQKSVYCIDFIFYRNAFKLVYCINFVSVSIILIKFHNIVNKIKFFNKFYSWCDFFPVGVNFIPVCAIFFR